MEPASRVGDVIPEKFMKRAADQHLLVQQLFREVDRLREDAGLGSRMAIFSIYAQWIEWSLSSLITLLLVSTSEGELLSHRVKDKGRLSLATKEHTLGQKTKILEGFELGDGSANELMKLTSLLKEFVPLRNKLTHAIFATDFKGTTSHEKALVDRLDAATRLAERIINEQQRIDKLLFPDLGRSA